jgi:hypothetical protein
MKNMMIATRMALFRNRARSSSGTSDVIREKKANDANLSDERGYALHHKEDNNSDKKGIEQEKDQPTTF